MSVDDECGVPQAAFREGTDVYIIYSFEDVAFHWEHATGIVRRRFRGDEREGQTDHTNRLFNDARMGGRRASREEYERY
jgi:hypothetical protein